MSDLVGNPEDRVSLDEAHMLKHGLYLNNKIFNFFVLRCVDACAMYHHTKVSSIRNLNYLIGGPLETVHVPAQIGMS